MLVPTAILSLSPPRRFLFFSRHCYGFTHRMLRGRSAKRNLIHGGLRNETSSRTSYSSPRSRQILFLSSRGKGVRLPGRWRDSSISRFADLHSWRCIVTVFGVVGIRLEHLYRENIAWKGKLNVFGWECLKWAFEWNWTLDIASKIVLFS